MKILHIFSDGLEETAIRLVESQSQEHDVKYVDLSHDDIEYDVLVDEIGSCDEVISW